MECGELFQKASHFIRECYSELKREREIDDRIEEIRIEIEETGFYEHKYDELVHGSKMAWRNSNRCIGRLFWNNLHVFDAREVNDEDSLYKALLHHITFATNEGKVRPAITIFKADKGENNRITIYNSQLINYAGYETSNGFIGDPHNVKFTKFSRQIGWKSKMTEFELLPLVFSINNGKIVSRSIPAKIVKEVPIEHPDLPIHVLNLKWYAVPIISSMRLEIGGISYSAAPFNGWYTGAEIGARNFADTDRYNMLPTVAEMMGLDTIRNSTLWKDRALIELNMAVLYSYKKHGVTIVDHHTAAEQFRVFEKKETACEREVTGDWRWLIPPLAPATTHIYHKSYNDELKTPNFFQNSPPM